MRFAGPNGELLDVCCANGYLLASLAEWGRERGLEIVPFGIDYGGRLIDLARKRLPQFATHFCVGNAWDWTPPRRYPYVYTLWDCVPEGYLREFIHRPIDGYVENGGRLILGAYGSLSRNEQLFELEQFLQSQHGSDCWVYPEPLTTIRLAARGIRTAINRSTRHPA